MGIRDAFKSKVVRRLFALFLALYIASYLLLTLYGRYEPAVIGTNGVKFYFWMPYAFVNGYKLNPYLYCPYYPMLEGDRLLWHTWEKSWSGTYPIHRLEHKKNAGNLQPTTTPDKK